MNDSIEAFLSYRTFKLPKTARTRSGIEYTPLAPLWAFRDGNDAVSINFYRVPALAETFTLGLKLTLMWYFENRAPVTVQHCFNSFMYLLRNLVNGRHDPISQITPEDILAFKMMSKQSGYELAYLRPFIKRWVSLGAPGIRKDTSALLKQLKLKQSPVGVAVATLDQKKGPLTDLEFEAIQCVLADAYAADQIDEEMFFLVFLFMALGARPVQFAAMKLCDLITPKSPQDGADYILMVPRAKQRDTLSRDEFKPRVLARQIGEPLQRYAETIYASFVGRINDPSQAPLFPQKRQLENAVAPGFEYHRRPGALSTNVIYAFTRLRVPSERLSGPIPVSPIRFRRTFATRAAEEGLPLLVIAEMMDHATTDNVEVYAGLTSRIRARLNRAVAMHMAPLAQAFSGRIIQSEADATRPNQSSRIIDLRVDQSGAGVGSCGTHAHCGFAKPIACYACNSFEPWIDGPHEAMLDYLLECRDHLMKTADLRIASINDRSILGCAQVILRCREIKEGSPKHG